MNEIQRHSYLAALGIESYAPRWILPVAPRPRPCVLPVRVVAESHPGASAAAVSPAREIAVREVTEKAEVTNGNSTAPAALGSIEGASRQRQAGWTDVNPSAGPDRVARALRDKTRMSAPPPIPRFSLGFWRIGDELIVVDSREVTLALPTDRLLLNMLAALGYRLPALPKAEILRWPIPLLDNATADQGEAPARDMLQAYLEVQLQRRPTRFLWLLGEEAVRYILPDSTLCAETLFAEKPFSGKGFIETLCAEKPPGCAVQAGQTIALESLTAPGSGPVSAVVTPSLATLLRNPELKAFAWRAIQSLRIDRS